MTLSGTKVERFVSKGIRWPLAVHEYLRVVLISHLLKGLVLSFFRPGHRTKVERSDSMQMSQPLMPTYDITPMKKH